MTRFSSFEHVLGCFYFPTISFSCSFIFTSVLVLQNSMSFLKMCYRKTGHCVLLFHLTVTITISGVWEEEGQRKDMYCGEMLRNFCGMSLFYLKKVWGSFLCNMHLVRYREKREQFCLHGPYSLVDTYVTIITTGNNTTSQDILRIEKLWMLTENLYSSCHWYVFPY